MMNSDDTHINVEFADHHSDESNVPLLSGLTHQSQKQKPFMPADHELRSFGLSLKWCGLDHSSYAAKFVSYLTFTLLTVVVPVVASSTAVKLPANHPIPFNMLVQLPVSALSAIAFFTLSRFFRRYSLRQLLLVDGLQDDLAYVRRGYAGQLDKAFRYLAFILLPSFLVEVAHKIMVFWSARVAYEEVPVSSVVLVLVLASWVYRSGVFLVVCVLFRLTCELQLLRLEGFRGVLSEGCETTVDAGEMFREHVRIRKQLSVTSHRFRFFIIACLLTITVSQLGALLVLASRSDKNFFNSGELLVCSAVQLSGFFLCLMGAARITHRAQGIASVATRWHMLLTCASATTPKAVMITAVDHHDHTFQPNSDHDHTTTCIPICSQNPSSFHTRQALVSYLEHNNGGITLFGFALDRGLLHTLFAFEFSLVLWILSKVVVLS